MNEKVPVLTAPTDAVSGSGRVVTAVAAGLTLEGLGGVTGQLRRVVQSGGVGLCLAVYSFQCSDVLPGRSFFETSRYL